MTENQAMVWDTINGEVEQQGTGRRIVPIATAVGEIWKDANYMATQSVAFKKK